MVIDTVERDEELAALAAQADWPSPVRVHSGDAEGLLATLGSYELIFADAEGGKWTGLDRTIAALRPGGTLVVDDMDPARYTEAAHLAAVAEVRRRLLTDPRLIAAELPAATGLILVTRRAFA
ncbi:hypothetical protein [Paractinoplanes lichenicola]|uniref:hypothetical protein n=1 Tax=Paractinoplanes lichenicola TaxID=2802976 RepID=UPI0034DAF1AF